MKKSKFIIIAENGVEDSELIYPFYRLSEIDNLEVLIASSSKEVVCKNGNILNAHLSIEELKTHEKSTVGILIPGGYISPERLRQNKVVLDFVKTTSENESIITAICHGVWVLISAGLMNKIQSTCYPGMKDDLINAGGIYIDNPVIIDGNIITGRRPRDLSLFMKEVINKLEALKN